MTETDAVIQDVGDILILLGTEIKATGSLRHGLETIEAIKQTFNAAVVSQEAPLNPRIFALTDAMGMTNKVLPEGGKLKDGDLRNFGLIRFKKKSRKLWTDEEFDEATAWLRDCWGVKKVITPDIWRVV